MAAAGRPVLVVGGGPAGLAAAEVLSGGGARVTLVDRMPSLGRKLLMAGRGGLNITHSEPLDDFLDRYGAGRSVLEPAIRAFPPAALRDWCEGLDQPCFTGSSGRVFPRAMKASPLLRAWLERLAARGVVLRLRRRLVELAAPTEAVFAGPEGEERVAADALVLALGGGSWSRLGSDGAWSGVLGRAGIPTNPFVPSNCGFRLGWSPFLGERFAGEPLKSVRLRFGDRFARGDLVLTRDGIEGGAIYPLAAPLRDAIERHGSATLLLDLRPDLDAAALEARLRRVRPRETLSNALRKGLAVAPAAVALLRECGIAGTREPAELARAIKAVPLRLLAPAPLDLAISTAGGLPLDALDGDFMLRSRPGCFCGGEMLDWDAPTGGYLLQASIATGRAAGSGALRWLDAAG